MNSEKRLPNLLLAGAPKCGTTSVYDWLVKHPEISGGADKELFYLLDSSDWMYNPSNNWIKLKESGYSAYYARSNRYLIDGTTLTMYQDCALEYAKAYNAKVLIFIREPADRIYSTFKYFRDTRTVLPKSLSFPNFIDKVQSNDKFQGNNQLAGVIEQSYYSHYVEKWVNAIGESNVKVIDFKRLRTSKFGVMKEICEWLKVDSEIYKDFNFSHKNETKIVRFRLVNKIKELFGKKVKNEKIKSYLRPAYNLINKKKSSVKKTNEEVECYERLKKQFSDEVSKTLNAAGEKN